MECPHLKIVKTPDRISYSTGSEYKGDTHGWCRLRRDECPGQCKQYPEPPTVCSSCGKPCKGEMYGIGKLCDACADKQATQRAWERDHPIPGTWAYRRKKLRDWAEDE